MRVRISARNVELAASAKRQVVEEVERLTRFYDGILEAEISITQEKHRQRVDVRLHVNGRSYQAEATGDNLHAPLDEALKKLRRQLQRYKSKLRRQSLRAGEAALQGKTVRADGGAPALPELPETGDVPRRRRGATGARRSSPPERRGRE
ncbi:MAG: ribosome hibernation-promoting factor, HPF/YfiA family [Gemmatimonadota bacterium]